MGVGMPILEACDLHKTYREKSGAAFVAVQQVSLAIAPGEVLAFLGPNGAGKTTSIKMIAGLIRPDRGIVRINGIDPHSHPRAALKQIGAVLEGNRNIYWNLTAAENLEYFGVLRGLSPREARRKGSAMLERFNLAAKADTEVKSLSRGMQQKLAIAVSMLHSPHLLLLDEPTLGLDVEATQDVKRLVQEIAQEGRAILLTTHQLAIAEELSDRVAIINQGVVVAQQPTQELIRQFSGSHYEIEYEGVLSAQQQQQLQAMDLACPPSGILEIADSDQLYAVLDILKPLPIVRLQQDRANLTEVFLKVIQR
jgi:ABC-2 type transport system ATP-binding protein